MNTTPKALTAITKTYTITHSVKKDFDIFGGELLCKPVTANFGISAGFLTVLRIEAPLDDHDWVVDQLDDDEDVLQYDAVAESDVDEMLEAKKSAGF